MRLDPVSGLVVGVPFIASPNCNARPAGTAIDVVVVHAISLPPGQFGGPEIEAFFCNRLDPGAHPFFETIAAVRVSAHFLVRRSGEPVQFVPATMRAWHAGESFCLGRRNVNDFSVGIELEGCDEVAFEDAQYETLARLTRCLMVAYPAITMERIFGHSDVAPGRKTDPGPHFDWGRLRRLLS